MHTQQKKTTLFFFFFYLSWRKKNGTRRLHIWSDLTNKSASHLLGLSHEMAQPHCCSNSQPWTVLRFEIAQWLHTVYSAPHLPLIWGQRRWGKNLKEEVKHFPCKFLKRVMAKIVVELPMQIMYGKPKEPTNKERKNRIYRFTPNLSIQRERQPKYTPFYNSRQMYVPNRLIGTCCPTMSKTKVVKCGCNQTGWRACPKRDRQEGTVIWIWR